MNESKSRHRLAVVISHPTQYYSPWFRQLATCPELELKVFYLWDFGVTRTQDRSFETSFTWDIPLLEGYEHEFVANVSKEPGTHHFRGLDNPSAVAAVSAWRPDSLLMFGYNYSTHLRLMLSPRLASVAFLFRGDSHELFPSAGFKPRIKRLLRSLIFRRFHRFLAVGQANVGYFRHSGRAQERITIVPHCVDNKRFQMTAPAAEDAAATWKRELGIPENVPVVLFAGKFEEKKRPLDLLRAFLDQEGVQSCESSLPSFVLLFVGSGPLEKALRSAAGEFLGRSIFFASFQNQTEMPKVYATGDVLVLPSHGRGETWGLAVNEAMNLAKPAIVSSHVGCGPDLIIEGETGWIFPAGDVSALQQTLAEALSDRMRLKRMGLQAREYIANYSYERATSALLAVVEESI